MELIDFMQDRIDCLENHISKLIAQNNRLRGVLLSARNEIDRRNHCDDKLKDLCDFITDEVESEQLDLFSLNEIKAQAIAEYAESLAEEAKSFSLGDECKSKGSSWYNWQKYFSSRADRYAYKLRQQAKAGE